MRERYRYQRIAMCIIFALLAAVILVGAEMALRTFPQIMLPQWQIRYARKVAGAKIIPDAEVGFLRAPQQRVRIRTLDFTALFETDNKGFANREPWPERVHIVFLGDSLVEGGGVNIDETFAGLIAQKLARHGVVNLGVAAAGPERQYRIYQRFGQTLQPSLVVAVWYLASDLDNDAGFHAWLREGQGIDYNTFRLKVFSKRREENQRTSFHAQLLYRSWLYGMGHETVLRWLRKDNAMPDSFRFANGEKILLDKQVLESMTKAVPVDEARIAALFTSLEKLRVLVWSQRAELMVMLLPSKEEIFAPGVASDGASVIARVRQRLQEINMPVLDLYPVLRERGATQSPYFSRDIHLNAYGNRSVAEQFVAWFDSHKAVQKY